MAGLLHRLPNLGRWPIAAAGRHDTVRDRIDWPLLGAVIALSLIGLVAVTSASIEFAAQNYKDPFYFSFRYAVHLIMGVSMALLMLQVPMAFWERTSWIWLIAAMLLLLLVLVPGVGREVNGSRRWLSLGFMNLQCSELAKVWLVIYLAGYLVRRQREVRENLSGFVKPMVVVFLITLLLMLEPDFGATVVTVGTAFGMVFLAGARLWQFILVILAALAALALLVVAEPYRVKRLTAFTDPWADQFNSGYQLIQSLIAFGRGEWFGVGLGNSVQKLFYLPEAHTDFVFAIFAEEFGALGSLALIGVFGLLIARILHIGRRAELEAQFFSAYVCYGIAVMLSSQIFINIGVATGLLPTKGLTLPFLSYGGSSLVICLLMMGLVFRVQRELSQPRRTVV